VFQTVGGLKALRLTLGMGPCLHDLTADRELKNGRMLRPAETVFSYRWQERCSTSA
jgi:hypothetical protein